MMRPLEWESNGENTREQAQGRAFLKLFSSVLLPESLTGEGISRFAPSALPSWKSLQRLVK